MSKSILIVPEYGLRHIFWLIHGFNAMKSPDYEVVWTNKKLWPMGFGPCDDTQWVKHERYDKALSRLDDGGFDAVLFSDGTQIAHVTSGLRNRTVRIYLDSIDPSFIVSSCLRWADIYLKCQYQDSMPPMVGDDIMLEPYTGQIPIIPWPYCTSSWIDETWLENRPLEPSPSVHFHGWSWPPSRVEAVRAVRAVTRLTGGLYGREELPIDIDVPADLLWPRKDFATFIKDMISCRVALNVAGNGQMCFRMHEALQCGVCCVSQHMDVRWPGRPPENGVEWFECFTMDELAECCRYLVEAPEKCAEVGRAGRSYWESYCSPVVAAKRLVETLGWQ